MEKRISALDGLRGWAALSVVVFHFTWELFGDRFQIFWTPVLALFFNGPLAVSLFFAISGYVLTANCWGEGGRQRAAGRLLKRYPRLTIPIVFCTLLVWALMTLGLAPNIEAARLVGSNEWLGRFLGFEPELRDAAAYSTLLVYLGYKPAEYNPFLWTMQVEMWGSIIVLGLCMVHRWRALTYGLLAVCGALALVTTYYATAFVGGAALALYQSAPGGPNVRRLPWSRILFPLALVAGATPQLIDGTFALAGPASCILLWGVLSSPVLQDVLDKRPSQFLGKLSFPLYLVQFPVLVSFSSMAIIELNRLGQFNVYSALAVAVASVVLTVLLARLFWPIEHLAVSSARVLHQRIIVGARTKKRREQAPPEPISARDPSSD